MKLLCVVFGVLLFTLTVVRGRPTCEECEEAPLAIPDESVLKVKVISVPKAEPAAFEEASDDGEGSKNPFNVIDAPVVCPEGQKPDNKGKCREVWSRAVPL